MNINYKRTTCIFAAAFILSLLVTAAALAGAYLDSPAGPADSASQMYTLEQIYDRLTTGAAATKMTTFTEPTGGPGSTMHTLDEIMAEAPALDNTNGAAAADVLSSNTFWGVTSGEWGLQTGTMANRGAVHITPGTADQTIAEGYHNGSGYLDGDANLVAGNIRSGVDIFGVSGNSNVVNTGTGDAAAIDIQQGKKAWVDGSEVTGQRYGGCHCANGTLNGTRWCDNGDGTVTDLLGDSTHSNVGRCLVWLKNANCSANLAGINKTDRLNWDDAMVWSSAVSTGNCGLSDGSSAHKWRMPTIAELDGITNGTDPVLSSSMQAFTGVQLYGYWSSTSFAPNPSTALFVYLYDGNGGFSNKTGTLYVWPVRSGQ